MRLKGAARYVSFDLPSQPVMWARQVVLMYFANKEMELEWDSADLPQVP